MYTTYENEVFKEIPETKGYYEISNYGRVFSIRSNMFLKLTKHIDSRGEIINTTPYYRVGLKVDGKCIRKTVHRFVAKAFLPKIEGKDQVNHIDGNGLNNHISNLEWVTSKENIQNAISRGVTYFQTNKDKLLDILKRGNQTQTAKERLNRLSLIGKSFGGSTLLDITFKSEDSVELEKATLQCNNCKSLRTYTEGSFRQNILHKKYVAYCRKCGLHKNKI
ncbi:NUMOD4 motif-containing HNH endonuclease [Campylobacter fetus]|uniref:NUMOD4 motif-containing HNH endonuclease n=1 Tax=Campylobacter fetus TaxID=196 RepID=UPI0008187F0C|nr:NUMOD4 motif-containing HNH endonuclease [Campylobacter fetus]